MTFSYRHLLSFLLFFGSHLVIAQIDELKAQIITGGSGFNLGKINAMTQDKYGFMWLSDQSHNGIVRYDGLQMVQYSYDHKSKNGLGGYYPEALFADKDGNIWIGFYGQGLDMFNPVTKTFTHYDHADNDQGSLSNDFVTAILEDHLGNVWVGTYGCLLYTSDAADE